MKVFLLLLHILRLRRMKSGPHLLRECGPDL
jgi:hypothetical protein